MLGKLEEQIMDKWNKSNVREGDIVTVMFEMKVDKITGGELNNAQIFGYIKDGMCVSAPLSAVVVQDNG